MFSCIKQRGIYIGQTTLSLQTNRQMQALPLLFNERHIENKFNDYTQKLHECQKMSCHLPIAPRPFPLGATPGVSASYHLYILSV